MEKETKSKNAKVVANTLVGYYNALPTQTSPKTDFIIDISVACKVREATARNWVKGRSKPKEQWQIDEISKITHIPASELFGNCQ